MTPETYNHIASSPAIMAHIAAGVTGIFSGTVALFSRKGLMLHRVAGTGFFASMLITGALASYLAVLIHQRGNIVGGIFTFYLVATAWVTVRRKEGSVGRFERVAVMVPMAATVVLLIFGLEGVSTPTQMVDGAPAQASLFMAAVAALAAAFDVRLIRSGGISGAARIARHLWRMCFGFFIATGSFFIGQQKAMPAFMHGSPILLALGVAPLLLMFFWWVRVRLTNWYRRTDINPSAAQ